MIGSRIAFELESLSPILFNKYLDEPQPKTAEGFREQGPRKCHKNDDGYICITQGMIVATMREVVGDLAPRGKGTVYRRDLMAGVFFEEEMFPTGHKKPDGIDARPVIRGKGAKTTLVICYRPMLKAWKISGTMILVDVQEQLARQCLERAGYKAGIASFRPRFGRFAVTKWEVKNGE